MLFIIVKYLPILCTLFLLTLVLTLLTTFQTKPHKKIIFFTVFFGIKDTSVLMTQ